VPHLREIKLIFFKIRKPHIYAWQKWVYLYLGDFFYPMKFFTLNKLIFKPYLFCHWIHWSQCGRNEVLMPLLLTFSDLLTRRVVWHKVSLFFYFLYFFFYSCHFLFPPFPVAVSAGNCCQNTAPKNQSNIVLSGLISLLQ
jgi:hypothetical protein